MQAVRSPGKIENAYPLNYSVGGFSAIHDLERYFLHSVLDASVTLEK